MIEQRPADAHALVVAAHRHRDLAGIERLAAGEQARRDKFIASLVERQPGFAGEVIGMNQRIKLFVADIRAGGEEPEPPILAVILSSPPLPRFSDSRNSRCSNK